MKIVKSSFLRLLCAFFALGIALLLCACSFEEEGRSKETAQLPSMKTMDPGSVFLTFGARFAPVHQFTAEEITWLEKLLSQAEQVRTDMEPEILFYLEYLSSDTAAAATPVRQYLEFSHEEGCTFCRKSGLDDWFQLPDEAKQLWGEIGLEAGFLYDPDRTVACNFEACPEAQTEYRIPRTAAEDPQQALQLLFRQFLAALRSESPYRCFLVLSATSVECSAVDAAAVTRDDAQDWGYAALGLGENEWVTFCSAGVVFLGTLGTWGTSYYGETYGADQVRWGKLRLEAEEYVFQPVYLP